jgi:uncharacterized protein YyaL (SSP411 family)
MLFIKPPFEIAIVGPTLKTPESLIKIPSQCHFSRWKTEGTALLEGKLTKGETVIYVCQNKSCQRPTTDVEAKTVKISLYQMTFYF